MDNNLLFDEGSCPVCGCKDVITSKDNEDNFVDNFYLQAIRDGLDICVNDLEQNLKVFECNSCKSIYCDPWFNSETSFEIFENIYGQHNRGWDALYGWLKGKPIQDYWFLIDAAKEKLGRDIDSYAEYHCPFQGNFFRLRDREISTGSINSYYRYTKQYLTASTPGRMVSKNVQLKSKIVTYRRKSALNKLNRIEENVISSLPKRYLALESSTRFWNHSCISDDVNCKPLASKLLNVSVLPMKDFVRQKKKIDVFSFINTLDHTHDPMALLEQALEFSNIVFLISHSQKVISKQHKFVFQKGFDEYLRCSRGWIIEHIDSLDRSSSTEINKEKISLMIVSK